MKGAAAMAKVDFKKVLKQLYSPSAKEVAIVDVPEMSFAMIDGAGDPNTSGEFQDAIAALYGVSYTLKFMLKKGQPPADFVVMPLEALWWMADMSDFDMEAKDRWAWTAMIMQPEPVTADLFAQAVKELAGKKDLPALSRMRSERLHEGLSAQVLHVGPYADEAPTVARLHDFIRENGYALRGKHHEVYLGDPRRTAPEKLKTVVRQPVK
jgi:hypothetical protein